MEVEYRRIGYGVSEDIRISNTGRVKVSGVIYPVYGSVLIYDGKAYRLMYLIAVAFLKWDPTKYGKVPTLIDKLKPIELTNIYLKDADPETDYISLSGTLFSRTAIGRLNTDLKI